MPLLTISDLDQPAEYKAAFVQQAMQLSSLWTQWKKQHDDSLNFSVRKLSGKTRPPGLHASEISGCPRRLVYALRNEDKRDGEKDVNMQRRFDLGTAVHELLQWEFGEMSKWIGGRVQFQPEVNINPRLGGVAEQYNMHSSCDGCFTFNDEQMQPYMRVGLEIKTASDKEFEKLSEPKLDHKEQTCFYMKALDLPLMWTLYYNKSSSYTTGSEAPWLFQFDKHLWETQLERRIVTAYEYVSKGQLPAKQEGRPCGWCPYSPTCQPSYLSHGRTTYVPSPREF